MSFFIGFIGGIAVCVGWKYHSVITGWINSKISK